MTAVLPGAKPAIDLYRQADLRMRDNLPLYCANLVKIVDKAGTLHPLALNEAQLALHERLEKQLANDGWVRALVLKARQLGISTYVGGRFYHRTSLWCGRRSYILTHEDKATQNLFDMAKRIHDHMPGDYKPNATAKNANEMVFGGIDSGYRVGTAKNIKGGGRSLTLHNFHGSEVAFWAHAEVHLAGVMQALPQLPGTESILESTANGVGGKFYDMWSDAEAGRSDYTAIFLPWYIASEYRRPVHSGYQPSAAEEEYATLHRLDEEQLCWLHFKNIELGGRPGIICANFKQEYPGIAAEAFQSTGEESFIAGELVLAARRRNLPEQSHMPRVVGVDVARGGKDRTRIIDRQGRKLGGLLNISVNINDGAVLADKLGLLLKNRPDIVRMYIDATGIGGIVYDILKNAGFSKIVVPVDFGSRATEPEKYGNRRAEIWARYKEWLEDPSGVDCPDDDVLHRHTCGPGFRYKGGPDGRVLFLEPKEDIKKRLGFSPDAGDAPALTFYETQIPVDTPVKDSWWKEESASGHDWMTA